jgi:hypothetical protein
VNCARCGADLRARHVLDRHEIPAMRNHSRILVPKCERCDRPIELHDVRAHIQGDRKALLITGTAGAGKTALGQLIEQRHGYVFVDGDAVQKRENYFRRLDPNMAADHQTATLHTLMILLGLGYHAAVGYIIEQADYERYVRALAEHGIRPAFRVLVPERAACIARDNARACWTAGERWVDAWYAQMRGYRDTHPAHCVDSTHETLEETYERHFRGIL